MQQRYSEGYSSYQGRSSQPIQAKKKSAEVIVVTSNEPCPYGEKMEVSQRGEGPNIKLFRML